MLVYQRVYIFIKCFQQFPMNLPRVATTWGYAGVRSRDTLCSPRGVQVEVYCESSCDNSFNYFKVRIMRPGSNSDTLKIPETWMWDDVALSENGKILPQWFSKWETWLLTIRFWGTIWDKNMSWQQNDCSCGYQHVMEFYHVWPKSPMWYCCELRQDRGSPFECPNSGFLQSPKLCWFGLILYHTIGTVY